jgi:hypothetical protein
MTAASPRALTVFDTTSVEVASVALADVARDIRRYDILGTPDDPAGTSGAGARP